MWDERIDGAARDETIGSPGGDFKARVLERIDQDLARGGTGDLRWRWIVAPLAVAAVLVIALVIYRGNRQVGSPIANAPSMQRDIALAPEPVRVVAEPFDSGSAFAQGRHAPPIRPGQQPFVSTMLEPAAVDDVDAIAPLAIAPIQVDAMEIADSDIPLLSVSAIDVPALDQ